jgi:hypothetical protein
MSFASIKLRTERGEREVGGRVEHLLDALRGLALPARANDQVIAGFAAGGSAADVAVVKGVAVVEHHRVVTFGIDGRHRNHDRFGTQIEPGQRIGGVAVGRRDRRVFIGEDTMLVVDVIERRLPLPRVLVEDVFVHDAVVHDERQAVNEAFLGDGLDFRDAGDGDFGLLVGHLGGGDRVGFLFAAGKPDCGDGAAEQGR